MHFSVITKKLPQSQVELTIEVPWEAWQGEIDHTVTHIAERQKFEGFRPGKAPRAIVEKQVGKEVLLGEAAEHALKHVYPEVLKHEKIDAIGRPEASIEQVVEGETLRFVVTTTVVPEIELGEWKTVVKRINADIISQDIVVDEAEVEREIGRLAESRAKSVTVNRPAMIGDEVEIDFDVMREGVPIEGGSSKKHHIVLGKGTFIPGFEDQLQTMAAGEEKTFTLTFPSEYHAKHLAGQPAQFHVTLNLVQAREIPVVDDAFAQSLGSFKNLEELRENFRAGMLEEMKGKTKEDRRGKIVNVLTEATMVELPTLLIDEELVKMFRELEFQITGMGMAMDDYLLKLGKTREELYKDWQPQAEKRIKSALVLEHLAKEREIEPSVEGVELEMNKALQYYRTIKDTEKHVDMERLYTLAKGRLRNEEIFQYLESL